MRVIQGMVFVAGLSLACASPKPAADTTAALATVDTLKPAVVATPDTVGASTAAKSTTPAKPVTSTKTTSGATTKPVPRRDTALVARDTTHLGRDSVIRINPRDPRRTIPPVKPPR